MIITNGFWAHSLINVSPITVTVGFLTVPGAGLTLEIMEYHNPVGRKEPIRFAANDVSGARHVALKVVNIEEAFAHI